MKLNIIILYLVLDKQDFFHLNCKQITFFFVSVTVSY